VIGHFDRQPIRYGKFPNLAHALKGQESLGRSDGAVEMYDDGLRWHVRVMLGFGVVRRDVHPQQQLKAAVTLLQEQAPW
jgi:hypothetical protein